MSIKLVAILLIALQCILSGYKYRLGLIIFVFIQLVLPEELSIIELLSLNACRLSLLAQLIFLIRRKKDDTAPISFPFWKPILLFSLILLPTYFFTTFSEGFPRGAYVYLIYFFSKYFLPGIVLYYSIRNYEDFKAVIKGILLSVLVMGIYGLYEYMNNYNNPFWDAMQREFDLEKIYDYGDDDRFGFDNRIKSTAVHAIVYGGRLINLIPVLLLSLLPGKDQLTNYGPRHKVFITLALTVLFLNIFLTVTRTCWVSAGLSVFLVFFFERKVFLSKSPFFRIGALLIVGAILYFLPALFHKVNDSNISGSSISLRMDQFNFIFDAIVEKEFYLGYGPGAITSFIDTGIFPQALGFESFLFEVFVAGGLVAFIAYLILYSNIVRFIRKKISTTKSFIYALFISHLSFIMLTGERQTFFVFFITLCILIRRDALMSDPETATDYLENSTNYARRNKENQSVGDVLAPIPSY